MFSKLSVLTLARAALLKNAPVYVQFYVTARCNLTCQQCNIIYANSDVRECTLDDVERIADNFAAIGVAMVLLTGGEPFARHDLHHIIRAFESRGVHARMQTNGHASTERIHEVVEYGGRDISISLDSLTPARQDDINGGFSKSWEDAVRAIADFTQFLPNDKSFASLGCVLQRNNLGDIEDVIRFGTAIGWFTSLVPIHVSTYDKPMGFRTFDQSKRWAASELPYVAQLVERVRSMRNEGYLLYDSDQYLDDILRFVAEKPTRWREKNSGLCDSPNLYFAVLPNGDFAPCCDFRLRHPGVSTIASDFPQIYVDRLFRNAVREITSQCGGCMYGSYPEMTIAMRYLAATWDRVKLFIARPPTKPWPLTLEQVRATAERIRSEPRERISVESERPA